MQIRAADVVRLHDRMTEFVTDPQSMLPSVLAFSGQTYWPRQWNVDQYVRRLALWLRMAELFYVTDEMTTLARAAAAGLPYYELRQDMLPTEIGLIMWGGVAARVDFDHTDDPTVRPGEVCELRAALWAPVVDDRGVPHLLLNVWQDTDVMLRTRPYSSEEAGFALARTGPLAYHEEYLLPWGNNPLGTGEMRPPNAIVGTAIATWIMTGQRVTAEERVPADRATRRRHERDGKPPPRDVRMITLRRAAPRVRTEPDPARPARVRTHRWPVSGYGYWRNTWYPSQQEHRLQFVQVPTYIKGDPDLPLIPGKRVNVLRR